MNGRTNAKNGAGAIRNGCAVLEVRALAHSQITAIRADGLTKKQDKGYVDLSNSNYWFYYIIIQKFELSGLLWTVTATLGMDDSETVTDTVVIDSNKQYELTYDLYLLKDGVLKTSFDYEGGSVHMSSGDGWVEFYTTGGAYHHYDAILTEEFLGPGTYTKLIIDVLACDHSEYIGISSSNNSTQTNWLAYTTVDKAVFYFPTTFEIDVSSITLTGNYFRGNPGGYPRAIRFKNIYLKR